MIVFNAVIGTLSAACLFAIICRLDAMTWRTHQPSVIAMHIGMGIGCAWALGHSFGRLDVGDIGIVIASTSWLWISLPTWASGPPEHTRKLVWPPIEGLVSEGRS